MKTAILVDAAFYLKRYKRLFPTQKYNPEEAAKELHNRSVKHLSQGNKVYSELYRILVYDCQPFEKRGHLPISKKAVNFQKSETAEFRKDFHNELRKRRKVALRLGELSGVADWTIKPRILKQLLNGKKKFSDLKDEHFSLDVKQKGVDMKIGLDIASLALKNQVEQIILIAGDSDFVPAAKMARREGIDFILDPMWNDTKASLMEHIDGLASHFPRPSRQKKII